MKTAVSEKINILRGWLSFLFSFLFNISHRLSYPNILLDKLQWFLIIYLWIHFLTSLFKDFPSNLPEEETTTQNQK